MRVANAGSAANGKRVKVLREREDGDYTGVFENWPEWGELFFSKWKLVPVEQRVRANRDKERSFTCMGRGSPTSTTARRGDETYMHKNVNMSAV